jgi:hypothetical protein
MSLLFHVMIKNESRMLNSTVQSQIHAISKGGILLNRYKFIDLT